MKPIMLDPNQNLSYGNQVISQNYKIDYQQSHQNYLINSLSAQEQYSYQQHIIQSVNQNYQQPFFGVNRYNNQGLYNLGEYWAPTFPQQKLKDYGEEFRISARKQVDIALSLREIHGLLIDMNYVKMMYLYPLNEMTHAWNFAEQRCDACGSDYYTCKESELNCNELIIKDVIE